MKEVTVSASDVRPGYQVVFKEYGWLPVQGVKHYLTKAEKLMIQLRSDIHYVTYDADADVVVRLPDPILAKEPSINRELAKATLIYEHAKRSYDRLNKLHENSTVSDQELDDAELVMKLAEIDVKFLTQPTLSSFSSSQESK